MQRIGNNTICAAIIALACFLPEVGLFVDGDILPKWYLFGLGLCAIIITYARGRLKDDIKPYIKLMLTAAASIVSIWAIAESAFNGWVAAHGPFDNPAGLAISLCCVMALNNGGTEGGMKNKWATIAMTTIMACAVIASQSRCGIVALMLISANNTIQSKRWFMGTVLVALFACGAIGLSTIKSASTSGRAFILQQTWEMVAEHPLAGWGTGGFERNYMLRQASFFDMHPDDPAATLADDIRHPLCEYLLWWVNYGVAGLLAIILLLFYPVFKVQDKGLRLTCMLICWFAVASYPLHYPLVWSMLILSWVSIIWHKTVHILNKKTIKATATTIAIISSAGICLHAASSFELNKAENASLSHRHKKALRIYKRLEQLQQHDPYYLYAYSRECYTVGLFEDALYWNDCCRNFWSSYDLALLRGDILFHLERYTEAKQEYRLASNMCPSRFAPLEGLMNVYEVFGDGARTKEMARTILLKPVKVPSGDVDRIKKRAETVINGNQE